MAGEFLPLFSGHKTINIFSLENVQKPFQPLWHKVSRLIKRRTVANEACDAGRVLVNDKVAKASLDVKVGDIIEIAFGQKAVKVRVLDIQDTTKKDEAKDLFEYI